MTYMAGNTEDSALRFMLDISKYSAFSSIGSAIFDVAEIRSIWINSWLGMSVIETDRLEKIFCPVSIFYSTGLLVSVNV